MHTIRVLYTEDDPADRELTLYSLRRSAPDVQLRVVGTGRETLEVLRDEPFDLVLLDYRLPDVEGLHLLREVVSSFPNAPVMMVTGSGDHEVAVAALKIGAADYLIKKPGHLERLPSAIREALSRFRIERHRRTADCRVMYAEHDPADVDLTLQHLAATLSHLQVETAGTGALALQRLEAGGYDLLLLDYRMPDLDGLQILQEMRERGIRVPVVMVTGHGDEETAVQALKLGALDYVVKRQGYLTQLPSTIESAIVRRALADEKEALLTLNGLAAAVASTLDLDELLSRVISGATTLLRVDHALVSHLSDDGAELIPAAWHGTPDGTALRLRFSVGQDVPGQAAAWRRAVGVEDIRTRDTAICRALAVHGIGGVLSVPMLARDRLLGVLTAATRGPRAFTPSEEMLLTALAAHAAVGIENAQLLAQTKRHAAELEDRVKERTRELATTNDELVSTNQALALVNQRLEMASRHKSEFLNNMSHEFRTPLNSIIGFAEILGDPAFGSLTEKQARFAQNILVSGEHLLVLVNDLLDLSRVEAGKIALQPEPFGLSEALQAAVTEITSQADRKYLNIEVQVDEAPSTLTADPVRFKQILLNLLSNAVKFTPEGGRITVSVRRTSSVERGAGSGERGASSDEREAESVGSESLHAPRSTLDGNDLVEIAVADTGIGIKPDDLPRLFQEFVRLDAAITKHIGGTGLGLALTKKLVELHGGSIAVTSEGEGRGSTFTVRLPLAAGTIEVSPRSLEDRPTGEGS